MLHDLISLLLTGKLLSKAFPDGESIHLELLLQFTEPGGSPSLLN